MLGIDPREILRQMRSIQDQQIATHADLVGRHADQRASFGVFGSPQRLDSVRRRSPLDWRQFHEEILADRCPSRIPTRDRCYHHNKPFGLCTNLADRSILWRLSLSRVSFRKCLDVAIEMLCRLDQKDISSIIDDHVPKRQRLAACSRLDHFPILECEEICLSLAIDLGLHESFVLADLVLVFAVPDGVAILAKVTEKVARDMAAGYG